MKSVLKNFHMEKEMKEDKIYFIFLSLKSYESATTPYFKKGRNENGHGKAQISKPSTKLISY